MFKFVFEEGFYYLYCINGCWFVVNEIEVIEMEIIIIIFILGKCIVICKEFVNVVFNCILYLGLYVVLI